jgi:hypothetical protein
MCSSATVTSTATPNIAIALSNDSSTHQGNGPRLAM